MKKPEHTATWYTVGFVGGQLKRHLRTKGFRIEKDHPFQQNLVLATKFFVKETIEIRGTKELDIGAAPLESDQEHTANRTQILRRLIQITLRPLIDYYSRDKRSLCLPGIEQNREVLEKLQHYFASNRLKMKVYVVNKDGSVDTIRLERKRNKPGNVSSF